MEYKALILTIVLLGTVGLVSAVPYVKLGEGVNITTYSNATPLTLSGTTFGLMSCGDNQILKYSTGSSAWLCQADDSAAGGSQWSLTGNYLYNNSGNLDLNETYLNATIDARNAGNYLSLTGGTMAGTINMDGNSLTSVGELIMTGLTTTQNIYPDTDGIYSIGNSTHYFGSGYFDNLYARGIDTTDLTSTNIDSTNLDSTNIDSVNLNGTNIESEVLEVENNITLGNFVMKDDGADMIIILT